MLGGIYSDQRCSICSSKFKDDGRRGLFCPNHPHQRASHFVVRFKNITRRFRSYESAQRVLTGLRYKIDENTFDSRDYLKEKPLGFANLSEKWLHTKEHLAHKSLNNLRNYMGKAQRTWGNANIKAIGYAEIEDLLLSLSLSDKTKSNIKSCLHDFWQWLRKRQVITLAQMPDFPLTPFELGWRKVLDINTQQQVIDEVRHISYSINPKIWIGIRWLSTYISMRPGEMLSLKEGMIDIKMGVLIIPHPKEKEPKLIELLDVDIEILADIPRGIPALPFFRHPKGIKGAVPGEKFGDRYLYKWWKKACSNLGVEGVDLYGGTRHSTVIALRSVMTPEEIKRGTMHRTNKAFDRYLQAKSMGTKVVYKQADALRYADNELITDLKGLKKSNLLKLKR